MQSTLEVDQRLCAEAAVSDCMDWILARDSVAVDDTLDSAGIGNAVEYLDGMLESVASFVLIREYMKAYAEDSNVLDPIEIMAQTHRRAVITVSGPEAKQTWLNLMSSTLYLLEKGDDFVFGQKFRDELDSGVTKREGKIQDANLARYIDTLEKDAIKEFALQFSLPR